MKPDDQTQTSADEPKFSAYELRSLALLESIDRRLKSIEENVDYFYRLNKSARDQQAAMLRMPPRY